MQGLLHEKGADSAFGILPPHGRQPPPQLSAENWELPRTMLTGIGEVGRGAAMKRQSTKIGPFPVVDML